MPPHLQLHVVGFLHQTHLNNLESEEKKIEYENILISMIKLVQSKIKLKVHVAELMKLIC